MEGYLREKGTARQLRLFACACCRSIAAHFIDPRSLPAVKVAEQYADGAATDAELVAVWEAADQALRDILDAMDEDGDEHPYSAAVAAHWCALQSTSRSDVVYKVSHTAYWALRGTDALDEDETQAALLEDILGRPASITSADPAWLTGTVVSLAEGIYADRAFDRLPILGDALEDAGCDDADILDHCRSTGPHVRGCWVLDLLLGKE
jgi:hypothetical protein